MTDFFFKLVGGVGLYLLGLVLLTDGVKAFAGDALRRALVRFTGTPVKAFGSGVLLTALVQSSSATTVTVIGFVSAGLLSFAQAVGVVIGASLGTTGTSWIVAVLGLKVSLGFYALPFVGFGAFLRLLGRGRQKSLGLALAGFGLIFIGIETLQTGMQGLAGVFNLSRIPSTGLPAHLLVMLIGVGLTVILQSSSAAIATTLTALHTEAVNFEQATVLVIGAAVGTALTSALAAIGGSVAAKRTSLAHIVFNLASGLVAIVLLPVFLHGLTWAQVHFGLEPGATSLAAFHTAFIALGVGLFLPWTSGFARLIERWLPERQPGAARHLDDTLLHAPAVALEAVRRAWAETAAELFDAIRTVLAAPADDDAAAAQRGRIRGAIVQIQDFLARIPPVGEAEPPSPLRVALMHAVDHLTRLEAHLQPDPAVRRVLADETLRPMSAATLALLGAATAGLSGRSPAGWAEQIRSQSAALAEQRRTARPQVLAQTASGRDDPARSLELLDAMRWLDRVGYHAWRICHYLGEQEPQTAPPPKAGPDPED